MVSTTALVMEQQQVCFQRLLKEVNLNKKHTQEGHSRPIQYLNTVHQLHCCEEESPATALKESQLLALEDI